MQQMHPEGCPNDRRVGVVVPAKLQPAKLEATQRDCAQTKQHHHDHADAHDAQIHAQTGKIDNQHGHATREEQEQVRRGKAEIGIGVIEPDIGAHRRPRREIHPQIEIGADEHGEHGHLNDEHEDVAPPDWRSVVFDVRRQFRNVDDVRGRIHVCAARLASDGGACVSALDLAVRNSGSFPRQNQA